MDFGLAIDMSEEAEYANYKKCGAAGITNFF